MRESLRVRLVLWYAVVLTLVVLVYGGAVIYQSWRSMTASVDAELEGYAREVAKALRPADRGRFDLELPPDAASYFFQREGGRPYYVIWAPNGEVIDRSDPDLNIGRPGETPPGRREVTQHLPGGVTVLVGRDIADIKAEQLGLAFNVVLAGVATLALSVFGGWFVAGRALAPIKRISETARAMSAGDLNARIAVDRTESELEQVASTLNEAFDRLRLAVEQERRFTADASHELRTPLSVLRAEAEWALDRERTQQEYKDALTVCRRAALRMQGAVERMLALVRAEAVEHVAEPGSVTLEPLIAEVLGWLAPLAQARGVQLAMSGGGADGRYGPVLVRGDSEQLREALSNLLSNAIVYNKVGGSVTVSLRGTQTHVRIEVTDTGIGIPAEAIPHVFDRFFRVDKARARGRPQSAEYPSGGSGLGLSIARAIALAHGGDISCASEVGTGSVFVMTLPIVVTADREAEGIDRRSAMNKI